MRSSLIYIPKSKPISCIRLFCFSYAGGSSATYMHWDKYIGSEIELALIQLPGRGSRLLEQPYKTMGALVEDLLASFNCFNDKPSVFFGHSMGARVAYEVIFKLYQAKMPLPLHLIASASPPPCYVKKENFIYNLPDNKFKEKIKGLNGSPNEVLVNDDIMRLLMPALRADFEISETYINMMKNIIPIGVSVLAGSSDNLSEEVLNKWFSLFRHTTGLHWIDGDHFFVDRNRPHVLAEVNKILMPLLNVMEESVRLS